MFSLACRRLPASAASPARRSVGAARWLSDSLAPISKEEVEECPADGLGVHALASADISATGALVVRHLAVHPSETHDVDGSTAALRMLAGLRSLALAIDVRLEIEPLKRVNKGRYWLAAVAMLQCANGDEEACEVAEELEYGVEEREGERERREGGEEGGPWMP